MSEKISVIVLSYGDEKELNRCIDRVLQQNYKDYELIVVSANKNTELEEKVNSNDRMTLYIKDTDKLEDLRAYALSKASGNKILFIEPNDFLIDENSITTLDEVYTQKNADLLLNSFMTLKDGKFYFMGGEDEHILGDVFLFRQIENVEFRKLGGSLIKKSLFDEIDNDDLVKSDQVLLNLVSKKAKNIIFSYQNKYVYDEVAGNKLPELDKGKESGLYFSDAFKVVEQNKKNGYTNKIPEKISIALCTDENLVKHIGTLLYSVDENTSSFVDAYIIYDNLSEKSLKKLTALNDIFSTVKVQMVRVPDKQQEKINKISLENNGLPVTSCYRFILADLLPGLDRIIYLDIDTLVLGDLTELWRINLEGNFIGATKDALSYSDMNASQRFIFEKEMYFNSGVLLIDLNLFRECKISNKLIDFAINTVSYCRYGDQDILNYYFSGTLKLLDVIWNCGREFMDGIEDRAYNLNQLMYYFVEKDNQLEDISGQNKLNSLNGCLIKKEIFDVVGALNFEDNESLTATILEKADKVMVKHSDYLIKVFD